MLESATLTSSEAGWDCWKQWEIENLPSDQMVNLTAQEKGYQCFFESVWKQGWCAGGFLWKWHPEGIQNSEQHSNYSPQGKPVEKVIQNWFAKKEE